MVFVNDRAFRMPWVFLLFVLVPVIELMLLIELGGLVGTLPTLAMIVVTGMVGATLARRQGLQTVANIQAETAAGRLPAASLIDGVTILVAGALLLTPGILTDVVGFSLLVPAVRSPLRGWLGRRFAAAVQQGQAHVVFHTTTVESRPVGPVIDVTPQEDKPSDHS